jgi:hypothetical protein
VSQATKGSKPSISRRMSAVRLVLLVVMLGIVGFLASCGGGSEEFTAPTEKTEIIEETSAAEATSLADVPSKNLQRRAEE